MFRGTLFPYVNESDGFLRRQVREGRLLDSRMTDYAVSHFAVGLIFGSRSRSIRVKVNEENIPAFSRLYIEGENGHCFPRAVFYADCFGLS